MKRSLLSEQLRVSTERAVAFAREFCYQALSGSVQYRVCPCQSCDDHRQPDELVYPEDGHTADDVLGPWPSGEVVSWMWRSGPVPVWVDVSVFAEESGNVEVQLLCAGRFSDNPERLYYECDGQSSPFGIKSPALPPGWTDGDGKFDVNWRRDRMT